MPLFEYRCPGCESEFELLVRTPRDAECPECGGKKLEKLLSVPTARVNQLPVAGACPPSDAPPCNPHCCRLPQ